MDDVLPTTLANDLADGLGNAADLRPLADQLVMIAGRLRAAASGQAWPAGASGDRFTLPSGVGAREPSPAPASDPLAPDRPVPGFAAPRTRDRHLALARQAYQLRRRREALFGNPDLFGEPAWDILLDLYIAHAENKPVSVSSACIGSAAPATTGLRWLGVLAEEGLVVREGDPEDQRRVMVRLTARGVDAMERFFASIDAPG